jgi:hypothetical protein
MAIALYVAFKKNPCYTICGAWKVKMMNSKIMEGPQADFYLSVEQNKTKS